MKEEQVIIPKFITDDELKSFFLECYPFLGRREQAYWDSVLDTDYARAKSVAAKILNESRESKDIGSLKSKIELKCIEINKSYDYWCSEERKTRRNSYSLLNPTEFGIHNTAVKERNYTYNTLMYWKLFDSYLFSVIEGYEGEKQYFNDSGLKEISERVDSSYIRGEIRKIREASLTDSMEAIGKAKEILEATFKYILKEKNVDYGPNDDLNVLSKKVKKAIKLDEFDKGPGSKTLISGLNGIVSGLSELRNSYGDGHGKDPSFSSLPNCFGRLAVSSASTYIEFILQFYENRSNNDGGGTK